jgi:hypothetical protein
MADELGRSEEYVEAMLADMRTWSSEFDAEYKKWSSLSGLETFLTEAGTYEDIDGGKYLNVTKE